MMTSHQFKGVLISLLFFVVASIQGLDLGRILWIVLVLFSLIAVLYYSLSIAIRNSRRKRDAK